MLTSFNNVYAFFSAVKIMIISDLYLYEENRFVKMGRVLLF